LTIGDVASRVGMRVGTLREWERRHGFPSSHRLPSGHRRYTEAQVGQVREVLDRQRSGQSLPLAIRSVLAVVPAETSVFAAVADASARPAVPLSRRAMLAVSRSIEDAAAASGGPSIALGCFQREAVFRGCEGRWRELARGSSTCVVLADFDTARAHDGVVEVPVDRASPLQREWAVVVASRRVQACLAGWESLAGHGARFEAIWSVDPAVVSAALTRGFDVARSIAPGLVPHLAPVSPDRDRLHDAMELMDRIIGRLDR
jgi:DNA-binding transcriptional MerR regulator